MIDRYLYTLAAIAIHAYLCLYRIFCSYRGFFMWVAVLKLFLAGPGLHVFVTFPKVNLLGSLFFLLAFVSFFY